MISTPASRSRVAAVALSACAVRLYSSPDAPPSPQCLHDWGALQSTQEHSRALNTAVQLVDGQGQTAKVARHHQVTITGGNGFDSRRSSR